VCKAEKSAATALNGDLVGIPSAPDQFVELELECCSLRNPQIQYRLDGWDTERLSDGNVPPTGRQSTHARHFTPLLAPVAGYSCRLNFPPGNG